MSHSPGQKKSQYRNGEIHFGCISTNQYAIFKASKSPWICSAFPQRAGHLHVMNPSRPLVIELEIWSQPGSELEPDAGKKIAPRCSSELCLPDGIVLGLSAIPDPIDGQNLRSYLEEGELSYAEFREFCLNRGLPADVNAVDSAARFLAYSHGVPLAWIHLPASPEGLEFCYRVHLWARSHKYCLVEPSAEYCFIDGSSLDQLLTSDE